MDTARLQALFSALARLDMLLERAAKAADAAYGSPAPADPYRGLYIATEDLHRILARQPGAPLLAGQELDDKSTDFAALRRLAELYELNAFDQDAVLLALAPEIDPKYERIYAYLHDDVTRRKPSVDLILNLLCASREAKVVARSRFSAQAPLIRGVVVHLISDNATGHPPLLSQQVKLDESVLRFLLGQTALDSALGPCCTLIEPEQARRGSLAETGLVRIEAVVRETRESGSPLRLYFDGPDRDVKRAAAEMLAAWLPANLLIVAVPRALAADWDRILGAALREAVLQNAVLYFEECDTLFEPGMTAQQRQFETRVAAHPGISILEARRKLNSQSLSVVTVSFPAAGYADRRRAWSHALNDEAIELKQDTISELASRYRLTPEEIRQSVTVAKRQALLSGSAVTEEDLFASVRGLSTRDLGPLAQRIRPVFGWPDLVLAPAQKELLQEIVNQARYRRSVYEDWGFERKLSLGKGLTALFSGPPGTGKTMAAEVIASELKLDLFKIDLSQVVSKYIGETEKNLSKVFDEAGSGNCVLFFDECDALFGKRTEVKDAHDRYSNIEISYLLQKLDSYDHDGVCVLATNLRQNLDPAFARRIRFIVEIEFPDQPSRQEIWKKIWPERTPLAPDVKAEALAAQFRFSGGSIRNVALAAAFLAAAEHAPAVTMAHIQRAARRELEKTGRRPSKPEGGSEQVRVVPPLPVPRTVRPQ